MITYMKYLKYANLYRQKVKQRLTVAEGDGDGEIIVCGYIVSISDDDVLEMDDGNGYIILEMNLNVTEL